MLHQIDKRGKLLVKIQCDTCHWTKWMKPKQVPKYHNCPQCIQNLNKVLMTEDTQKTPQETSGRLEIPEPHKESLVPFEVIEVIDNNPEKHIETEVIKKPSKKHK